MSAVVRESKQRFLALLECERRVLEQIATGMPLEKILQTLVMLIEAEAEGMACLVTLADGSQQRLMFGAGPSIPAAFNADIRPYLRIAPGMAPCGSAAFLRKPVYVRDVAAGPPSEGWRKVALRHGFRAAWSTPILSDDATVLGTFAMLYGEPRSPAAEHVQLIDMAVQMARVAIQGKRDEELLRTIVEHAPAGIGIAGLDRRLVRTNPAFAALTGYTGAELRGKSFIEFTHEDDRAQSVRLVDELVAGEREHFEVEKRYVRKDGHVVWTRVRVALIRDQEGEPRYTVALVEDISGRRAAQKALERSARELQALSRRLVEVQEAERRELARELHDRVGQGLTALGVNLRLLKGALGPDAAAAGARLDDSTSLLESTVQAIENVTSELRPPMLDDAGLFHALKWYGEQFSRRSGIAVSVRSAHPERRIGAPAEIALFRIAQEALTNVLKHAAARRVEIALERSPRACIMTISDDGVGLDVSGAASPQARVGLGMVTMRERAQAVGGTFSVSRSGARGTRIEAAVPC